MRRVWTNGHERRYELFGRALDRCESFIERQFLVALLFTEQFTFDVPRDVGIAEDADGVILGQQIPVNGWHIDFAMRKRGWDGRIAIELDGHRFHNLTPEMVKKERVRERDIVMAGFRIIRFTSNEVMNDPLSVARQARHIVMTLSRVERPRLAKTNGAQLTLKTA